MPLLTRWLLAAALALPSLAAYGQETGPGFQCGTVIEYMSVLRRVQGIPMLLYVRQKVGAPA